MNITRSTISALLVLAGLTWQAAALAQAGVAAPAPAAAARPRGAAAPAVPAGGTEYSEKGADTCLGCHDAGQRHRHLHRRPASSRRRHAHRGDARAPFGPGGLQCEACHGPGARHSVEGQQKTLTINSLKANSFLTPQQRNEPCLAATRTRRAPPGMSARTTRNQLACTDCHQLHAERDPVLAKDTQPEVCFHCHQQQRADFHKSSSHPVRFGRMGCSDCHNVHGSTSAAMLNKPTREPDLLQLPRRKARTAAVGACAGGRGLHAVPLEPWLGAPGAADQDAAAAVPAMPLGRRPSVGRAHRRRPARRQRRRARCSCSPAAAPTAIRRSTAPTTPRAPS